MIDTQDDPIDEEILEKFTNPPVREIASINTKQKEERVSVKALVERVRTRTIYSFILF